VKCLAQGETEVPLMIRRRLSVPARFPVMNRIVLSPSAMPECRSTLDRF
jgi:hypothetical protein